MSAARASRAGSAFDRLGAAATANPVPTGERPDVAAPRHPDTVTPRRHDTTTPRKAKVEPIQRFTVRFYEQRDVDGLDLWLLTAKRQLGQKVDKARVVRELLRMAVEDPELTARLYARLREDETP